MNIHELSVQYGTDQEAFLRTVGVKRRFESAVKTETDLLIPRAFGLVLLSSAHAGLMDFSSKFQSTRARDDLRKLGSIPDVFKVISASDTEKARVGLEFSGVVLGSVLIGLCAMKKEGYFDPTVYINAYNNAVVDTIFPPRILSDRQVEMLTGDEKLMLLESAQKDSFFSLVQFVSEVESPRVFTRFSKLVQQTIPIASRDYMKQIVPWYAKASKAFKEFTNSGSEEEYNAAIQEEIKKL